MDNYDYNFEKDVKYCYPDSDVLKNKLNIRDAEILDSAERKITALRIAEIEVDIIKGCFDLDHMKKIHKHIFKDIYSWAGQLRTVDISKGNLFCLSQNIVEYSNKIFEELKKDNYLKNLELDDFISKCAYYLGEINALHPFREGNGRVQRLFIEYLGINAGYDISFYSVSDYEMIVASAASFVGNYELLKKILYKCTKKIKT